MGGAGVKPPVQGVLLLGEAVGLAAVGAGETGGEDVGGLLGKPGVGPFGGEEVGDHLDGLVGDDGLAAVLAVEHGDGQAPPALAGDAPVGALPDHGLHPVQAQAGTQRTSSQAAQASSLKVSTEQNHWGVARKMMGFLHRQQWG